MRTKTQRYNDWQRKLSHDRAHERMPTSCLLRRIKGKGFRLGMNALRGIFFLSEIEGKK